MAFERLKLSPLLRSLRQWIRNNLAGALIPGVPLWVGKFIWKTDRHVIVVNSRMSSLKINLKIEPEPTFLKKWIQSRNRTITNRISKTTKVLCCRVPPVPLLNRKFCTSGDNSKFNFTLYKPKKEEKLSHS
jgi:CRISPR/Cas system CMR-associated protein Cmr1 (group 7 of RAMP superfamily)